MSLTLILTLFFIMDPLGNLSAFLTLVKGLEPSRQRYIVFREMGLALIAMVFFNFLGEFILAQLNVTEITARIASGVLLFLIALKILFFPANSVRANLPSEEPFLIPLAIPLIAGPALLATIMLYAITEPSIWTMLSSIVIAWAASVVVLLQASSLKKLLGSNGLGAAERLTAMILVLLSLQRILEGAKQFIALCQT